MDKFSQVRPGTKFFTKVTKSTPCLKLGETIRTKDGRQLNALVLGVAKVIALDPDTPVSFKRPSLAKKLDIIKPNWHPVPISYQAVR